MKRSPQFAITLGISLLFSWTVLGTVGFVLIEGWSAVDSLYMTIITISTVGFGEVRPLTSGGRLFASVLIVGGLLTAIYSFTRLGQAIMEGELADVLGKRRMSKELSKLKDHTIVCGFGRVGRLVSEGLHRHGEPFCVIETNRDYEETLREHGYLFLIGDATDETLLEEARIRAAKSMLALLPSDADNLYLTIAARDLNHDIRVIAIAQDDRGELRLRRSGADAVVSPHRMAGQRMLHAAVNPTVTEFIDVVSRDSSLALSIAEVQLTDQGAVTGRRLADSRIRGDFGLMVMAVKTSDGSTVFNPGPDSVVKSGDILVVVGREEDIIRFKDSCGHRP